MLRTTAKVLQIGLAPPRPCLSFLFPSIAMSRRSTRLSAPFSPPVTSAYTVDVRAGPSFRTAQTRTDAEAIPDLEEWSTAQLQAEVKRYGFKVSRKRETLIEQLRAVYAALSRSAGAAIELPDPASDTLDAEEPPIAEGVVRKRAARKLMLPDASASSNATKSTSKIRVTGKGNGKGRQSDPFVLDASSDDSASSVEEAPTLQDDEVGDYTAQLEREAASATDGSPSLAQSSSSEDLPLSANVSPRKPRRSRSRSLSSDDIPLSTLTAVETEEANGSGEAVDPSPALAETMTRAIRSDADVWGRILRYEPISFDEITSIATAAGLSMATGKRKEELRTWLDRQCICFYSAELTGARSRH